MKFNKNLAVIICEHVFKNEREVKYVIHHDDNSWELMCGENDHDDFRKARVVGIGHLIERDPSIELLCELEISHAAEKNDKGDWEYYEIDEEE